MNKKNTCPTCGSSKISIDKENVSKQLTLGPEFSYEQVMYKCLDCGEEGDFTGENDKTYLDAADVAKKQAMKDMIEDLNDRNISMAYFERVFELPARTLTNWKSGAFSATSLALMRIVVTFPWITQVAENQFYKYYANQLMIKEMPGVVIELNSLNKESYFSYTNEGSEYMDLRSMPVVGKETSCNNPYEPNIEVR